MDVVMALDGGVINASLLDLLELVHGCSKLVLKNKNIIMTLYMWCERFKQRHVSREMGLAPATVVDWYNFCREAATAIVESDGEGTIVQIDESCFSKRKYKGKKKSQQWVFCVVGPISFNNWCFKEEKVSVHVDRNGKSFRVFLHSEPLPPGTILV